MNSKFIDNYCLNEVLGVGQYGKVYKGLNIKTNILYAVKLVKKQKFDEVEKLEEFTMNEIQTLVKIDNANIIKFVEMLKTPNHYYFVYEFCNGGTLEHLLKMKGHFLESEALVIFSQLVNAFQPLVKDRIMHRDLKPANILLHNDTVKLADFGFCKILNDPNEMAKTLVGSPIYMAPEVLLGHEYSQKAEIWSLGSVLFEMLFGECPYEEKTIAKLIQRVQNNDPIIFDKDLNCISEKTELLLKRMLVIDAEKRLTFEELFADEHVKCYYPSKEFDFANIVRHPNELDISKPNRIKKDRAIKYLYHERNKIFFMYNVLSDILELNCSNIAPLAAFFLMKFIRQTGRYLKKNLLDQINPSAFLQLKKLIENWSALSNTFEYKSFVNLVNKELELIEKEYPDFQAEAIRFRSLTVGSPDYNDMEIQKALESDDFDIKLYGKYLIQYVEEIKKSFYSSPLDHQKKDEENMKYLKHINEILDVLLIDEFFENFLDIYVKFENQKYFEMMRRYAKDHLLNIVTNKIVFTKGKLGLISI